MRHRPIIDDARFLATVASGRYAVLRPSEDVEAVCRDVQERLRASLAGLDIVYPGPHLTLRSFASGTELREAQAALRHWAARTAPFAVALTRVETFPSPGQLVYVRARRDRALVDAYRSFGREVRARGLAGPNLAIERWIPHVSLAYCDRLDLVRWADAARIASSLAFAGARFIAAEVELLAYEADGEHTVTVEVLTPRPK